MSGEGGRGRPEYRVSGLEDRCGRIMRRKDARGHFCLNLLNITFGEELNSSVTRMYQ